MVIISPQLGISPTATTGGETYDREVLKQFAKMGQDVRILLPKGKPIPEDISGWKIDKTLVSHFIPPYIFNLWALPWVIRQIKNAKLKMQNLILRIHSPEYLFWTAYMIKKLYPEVPIIVHYHLDQTGRIWTTMNRKLLNMVDAVITDSEYLKKRLINRVGIRKELIQVIHCGVDTEAIKPASKGPTFQAAISYKGRTLKTILFLGRFIERKRPDFAIEVFAKLYRKYPNAKLVMVGEGPMLRKLKIQSEKLKIGRAIEFTGPLFDAEKLKKYHETDLFLFPSEREGFVLVVLEAMAAGLPLLVPNSMGFSEAVSDGQNGFLAKSGDIDDWVNKVERILFDDALNISMRKNSRKIAVKRFSWERCARENLKIYRQVVQ